MGLFYAVPRRVKVVEVGPRDGLQNEAGFVPTGAKVRFIELLSEAGFEVVEATSFVSPRAVPQLADAEEVLRAVRRRPGVRYPVLVPNLKGLERALKAGVREVAVFTAASETFNLKNINMSIERSLEVIAEVVREARAAGLWVRGYISVCFGCPYEGQVDPEKVLRVAARLAELGVDEVSLGDTIGVATPRQVEETVGRVLRELPAERLALHFHDTRGTALANVLTGLLMGISVFDSSAGGLGGCPFAPGASGNLASEDLLYMLHGMGIETGVDLGKVVEAARYILGILGRPAASRYFQACQAAAVP